MPRKIQITIDDHLSRMHPRVRPIVESALDLVRKVAPDAEAIAYQSTPPKSPSAMWKLVHYRLQGGYVVGVGTFPRYSTIFFYRGRELPDAGGVLQGSGKDSRFIKLVTPESAQGPEVLRLVGEAFELARTTPPE